MSGKEKRPLVPRLRFPEFREAAEWGKDKLEELITAVSPPSKLQSSSYRPQGKFPIIDQSQELICGWTDDESAVIAESLPLIVFGDHTCVLKFVEKPFAQGADGIKILKAKPAISAEYLFHSLSHRPLAMEDYKRHFSILKERAVVFPDIRVCLLIHFGGFPFRRQTFFALFEPLPFSQPGVLTKRRSNPGSQRQQTSKQFWRIRLRRLALP